LQQAWPFPYSNAVRTYLLKYALATLLIATGCSGNGHLDPQPTHASVGDTAVNCNCNLTFDQGACTGGTCRAHFPIELCLPPELNVATIDFGRPQSPAGKALAAMTQAQFDQRVQDYCETTVTNIIYHVIQVFSGGFCQYKTPWAPQGGIGSSVACFPLAVSSDTDRATERKTGACEQPCPQVVCDYATNCGDGVEDSLGNINLDRCQCNQVVDRSCPGDPPDALPTPVFCRP
jgi:hypothetical protein